ncbi:DUF1127 domain-containing protein [Pseudomonas sp. NCCP-436]|uniref:DUF1127 domain-containing protein n=1 Tax=Pseudomonas sp. NCCP-436 TaxID=2842481 RepID=UPI001C7FCD61|nr:DUF1127 domain-containing protein [Pseudomonas sp. NCCP-436]GIZ10592.1 hypothetical protein NCCP436_00080 [Pseudomonas sp. NCCP-436]
MEPLPTTLSRSPEKKHLDGFSLYARLRLWQRNLRTRHQLRRLTAEQLTDAGISSSQRDSELEKPFWR